MSKQIIFVCRPGTSDRAVPGPAAQVFPREARVHGERAQPAGRRAREGAPGSHQLPQRCELLPLIFMGQ